MYSLTIPQQNIWNLHKFYEGTSIANNCGAIFFDKLCDHALLNRAINRLIALQEGMRLRFRQEHGIPVQQAAEFEWENFPTLRFDSTESFDDHAEAFAKIPFTADGEKMYRFEIFDAGDHSGVLVCISHLISDAWAISIIAHTIASEYEALSDGTETAGRSCHFLPFCDAEKTYLQSERYRKDQIYWAEKYMARPEITPIRPGSLPSEKPTARRFRASFSPERSASIDRFFREHNITQAVLIEAAVLSYLARINPELQALTLGIPVLNRSGAEQKRTIGMFISTTALTVPVSAGLSCMELCKEISRQHIQLFRHQKYPYSHILRDLHERFGFSGNLYDVVVSFQNAKSNTGARTKWYSNGFCEVGLEIHIDNRDSADCYTLNIDYQAELFRDDGEIALLVSRLDHLLEQIICQPDALISELSILPPSEEAMLLHRFNRTEVPYPRGKCIHELFCAQAAHTPDRTALVFEGTPYTYRQLDEMSNSLAHLLRERGVGPGRIVPIIATRSWHIIAAMLGILKAGGAYMSVDPTYPPERIQAMMEIANCTLALTFGYGKPLSTDTIPLEAFDFRSDITPVGNRNTAEDPCYIIIRNAFTVWFLERLGFRWAKIDLSYVRGYLDYFRELGYFPKEL